MARPRRDEDQPRLSRRRLFWVALAIVQLALLEVMSALVIALLNPRLLEPVRRTETVLAEQSDLIRQMLTPGVPQLHELHPVLGWRYAAGYSGRGHRLNAVALRSHREYARHPPSGVLRVAAFGDSFVYGTEVDNAEAWPALMEEDPRLEVLNYGVPGYGFDQAYLRYELEGADYAPAVVILGFAPTDLSRVVNVYRRFFHSQEPPLFKPRFELDGAGGLALVECPVRSRADYERLLRRPRDVLALGARDWWFAPAVYENPAHDYSALVRLGSAAVARVSRRLDRDRPFRAAIFNEESTAFRIQLALFERFATLVRQRGAVPLVLFLPDRRVLDSVGRDAPPVYKPLLQHVHQRGLDPVDATLAFRSTRGGEQADGLFAPGGHYSPRGNRVLASWLATLVRERFAAQSSLQAAAPGMSP